MAEVGENVSMAELRDSGVDIQAMAEAMRAFVPGVPPSDPGYWFALGYVALKALQERGAWVKPSPNGLRPCDIAERL